MNFPLLETHRTILRQVSLNDAEDIYKMYADAEAMRFRESPPLKSYEEAIALIQKYISDFETRAAVRWGIYFKGDNKLIGTIVWKKSHPENEFGYSLDKNYWRRGIMFEVVSRIISYLFEEVGLKYVTARAKLLNIASQELLLKTGFELIGENDQVRSFKLNSEKYFSLRHQ